MIPKPEYLNDEHASRFQYKGVVDAYHLRPAYPIEVFDILLSLITDGPRTVLDIGCGTGDVARNLVAHVERVDAVDISHNMLEEAKQSPNGNNPHIRWVYGRAEEAPLQSPYALVTAGESLHWMDWYAIMPHLQEALTPHGYLAILKRSADSPPWEADVMKSIRRFSTNKNYHPYDLREELEKRHLFQCIETKQTAPEPFVQTIDDFIEAYHSTSGLSRELMGEQNVRLFDEEVRTAVAPYEKNGMLEMQIVATIIWGKPLGYMQQAE